MKYIKSAILILFIIASLSPSLWAQESALKIACVNLSKLFDSYHKTVEADKELEKKAEKKNAERDKYVEKINKLKDEMALLSKSAREKKETELNEKIRELQDFDQQTKTNLQRERNDVVKDIFKEMDGAIKDYGAKNGYDVIFDDRVMLHTSNRIDITNKVLRALNKEER